MILRKMSAIVVCGLIASIALAQAPPARDAQVDALIRKLGSPVFVEREKARRDLEAIGAPALAALKRAQKPADLETQCRLVELIRRAEELELTRQILAPKEVHLKLNEATLDEAIAELAKLGYPLQFQGDRAALADKKITLDTGKTSFWRALDLLCDQAGLMERVVGNASPTAPLVIGKKGRIVPAMGRDTPAPAGPIVLTNRGPQKLLTSYAGAVKSQLRVTRDADAKELVLQLVVSVEPRLLNAALVGRPIVDVALDQERRKLSEASAAPPAPPAGPNRPDGIRFAIEDHNPVSPVSPRQTQIRIKDGDQTAQQIKEFAGKLSLQLDLANETIARIEKVLDAEGKSADGASGGTMKINSVRKVGDDIEVRVSMTNLAPNPFGNNIIINGGNVIIRGNINIQGGIVIGPNGVRVNGRDVGNARPDLVDAKGQKFQVASATSDGTSINAGTVSTSATIVYRPNPGQAAPRDLVLFGIRPHTIAVPFRFENVPLP